MSMLLSHFVPASPNPHPVSLSPFSTPASLCLTCPSVHQKHLFFFFRFHIYMLAYGICFSLYDLFHSVWQSLGPSTSLQITQFCFFLWLSNITLYICATFFLIDLYWSIIASQYRVSFCCTTKLISHMHTHDPISPPSWASLPSSLSHPSRSSQSNEPISLCRAASFHQSTILHSVVYICRCYSHFAPASPSYPMSSSPFSMPASLFRPCNWVHQWQFFF